MGVPPFSVQSAFAALFGSLFFLYYCIFDIAGFFLCPLFTTLQPADNEQKSAKQRKACKAASFVLSYLCTIQLFLFIIIHATPLKNDSFMVRCGKMSEKISESIKKKGCSNMIRFICIVIVLFCTWSSASRSPHRNVVGLISKEQKTIPVSGWCSGRSGSC